MKTDRDSSRPLLDWALCRGREVLRLQVAQSGDQYHVSVSPENRKRKAPLYKDVFRACSNALQQHAILVAMFRDAGWTSVSYR